MNNREKIWNKRIEKRGLRNVLNKLEDKPEAGLL